MSTQTENIIAAAQDMLERITSEVATPDDENEAIRAQVDIEHPRPPGGFATTDEEEDWKAQRDARFMELVNSRSQ